MQKTMPELPNISFIVLFRMTLNELFASALPLYFFIEKLKKIC